MRIVLKPDAIQRVQELAKIKLDKLQAEYTKLREDKISKIMINCFNVTGHLWWKVKTPISRDQALHVMVDNSSYYHAYYKYRYDTVHGDSIDILKNIINIKFSSKINELILTLEEYNLVYN